MVALKFTFPQIVALRNFLDLGLFLFRSWPFCKLFKSDQAWRGKKFILQVVFIQNKFDQAWRGKKFIGFCSTLSRSSEDVWKWKSEIWRDCTSLW